MLTSNTSLSSSCESNCRRPPTPTSSEANRKFRVADRLNTSALDDTTDTFANVAFRNPSIVQTRGEEICTSAGGSTIVAAAYTGHQADSVDDDPPDTSLTFDKTENTLDGRT